MTTVKYFDKRSLRTANNDAIHYGFNRSIREDVIEQLDDETLFPVVFTMPHNDGAEMRLKLLLSPTKEAWLDVIPEGYESLPHVSIPSH